jgi:multiple sugar transport system ATP-binding protein
VATVALRDVYKIFGDGTVAIDNVSLDVSDGEFMVLLGPSGCGKSTVLRMIAGLEDPSSGYILLDGDIANELSPRDRKVAMVFQDFVYIHICQLRTTSVSHCASPGWSRNPATNK